MLAGTILVLVFLAASAFSGQSATGEDTKARMDRYRQSLGVECTHCHIDGNWPDEAKPAFGTARSMSLMVARVNESLGNADRISCWTCHRGQARPSRQPAALLDAQLAKWPSTKPDTLKTTMAVYNVALGVDCDHCHTADWSSKDKPAMKMVPTMSGLFDIFPKYMPAGARTQCFMCHKGSTNPPARAGGVQPGSDDRRRTAAR